MADSGKQKRTKVFPARKPQSQPEEEQPEQEQPEQEQKQQTSKHDLQSAKAKAKGRSGGGAREPHHDQTLLLTEDAGYLEAEGMERTYKFRQQDIVKHVDVSSARKHFDLKFDQFGPYHVNYTRNGRHILIGGKKGHVGAFDWQSGRLDCELHLGETVRDVQWLHNETLLAVAQRKYVYVYDNKGLELHKLKNHLEVNRLEFLPYHFLLTSIGVAGYLRYHDTSTGNLLTEIRTKLGPCEVMTQNPQNAIIHLGHANGTVTYWSPNMHTPLVKMLCHTGPISAVAVDHGGTYMVTAGLDGLMKIWDVRTYRSVYTYTTPTPAVSLALSQKGLLAVGYGPHAQVWKNPFGEKQKSPYLNHLLPGSPVADLQFCPFEDVLGIGHAKGFTSILVPGAGEANIDALEANPFQTKKQRAEAEVKHLLEKIQPELIALDPSFVGSVQKHVEEAQLEAAKTDFEANNPGATFQRKERNKMRGRNTAVKKYLRKRRNVVDQKKLDIKADLEKRQAQLKRAREGGHLGGDNASDVLARFTKKPKF